MPAASFPQPFYTSANTQDGRVKPGHDEAEMPGMICN
ncbi:hypothetical protein L611_007000000020 [Aminobacter sp. J15]|nr:hypothetical protein L611_007000000020 [Aminobacter sp. J15]